MIEQLKKRLIEMSISNRIRSVFLPLIICSISIIIILTNNITKSMIVDKASQDVAHKLELIAVNIKILTAEAESCANAVIINIDDNTRTGFVRNSSIIDVQNMLNSLKKSKIIFSNIDGITYVDNGGDYITEIFSKNLSQVGSIKNHKIFKEMENFKDKSGWIDIDKQHILIPDVYEHYLTYVKKLRNVFTGVDLGYVMLNIHEHNVYDIYKNISPLEDISFKIVDNNNVVISSDERSDIGQIMDSNISFGDNNNNKYQKVINGKMMLLNSKIIPDLGWKVISLIPLSFLIGQVNKMTYSFILIGAVITLVALLMAVKLSQTITKPITDLTNHIRTLKDGNLVKFTNLNSRDEIGILNASFNSMIDRNKDLLLTIDHKERKKREYELALLQAQIKPHFLYNTLDIICRLAALNRLPQVITATKNIADFYRIALSKGDEFIPLSRELELAENYLSIQKIRYPDILDFRLNCSNSVKDYTVPKLSLQPIVENAIYHGLKAQKKKGIIEINSIVEKNDLILKVSDNGVGMNKEQIKKIFSKSTDMNQTKSFGVINVDERLKLYYGPAYGIKIESTPGKGTVVYIKICKKRKKSTYV